jgi:[acyl-carrier-protein] S-malonyltransferase
VGRAFRATLEELPFARPRLPYLPNRLGRVLDDPTPADFVELLATHVHSPVLWRQSIDHVVQRWPDAAFLEVGPLSVLHNLLDRKWHKVPRFHSDSRHDAAQHLQQTIAGLRALDLAGEG